MKAILAAALVAAGFQVSARADHYPGKIIYSECSHSVQVQNGSPLAAVCFATKIGDRSQYIFLMPANGQAPLELKIVSEHPVNGGINPAMNASEFQAAAYNGSLASGTIYSTANGPAHTLHIALVYYGVHVIADNFAAQMNTM